MPTTHTEAPWRAEGPYIFKGSDCIAIFDTDNAPASVMRMNAAYTARAVNHFSSLVACVEAALNMIDGDGFPPNWDLLRATLKSACA